jgi:hypothetical protein
MTTRRAPEHGPYHAAFERIGGTAVRRVSSVALTMALAALLAVTLLAGPGEAGGRARQISSAGETLACDEAGLRAAITDSEAVAPGMVYEVTYLRCADGFGWARISSDGEGVTIFLSISPAGITLLDLGSGICVADSGIPADVVPQIAPPRPDPALDCAAEPPTPIETEAHFTG